MENDKVIARITSLVEEGLPRLAPHLQTWVKQHLTEPRQLTFSLNENGDGLITLWLVTDNTGQADSSKRIVYDDRRDIFGLVMRLSNGVDWFMGLYGTLAESIDAM